ncbi:hypothetical protein HOLleu_25717 [Holothuria leucospilota]|uniref:Integrase zinc-binding domain-containing protein n=1 Tax=Holothuria leucospilota TaxID=206669 RepID=A0A9Q1BT13_HOLLE|nr:hypothetical protein HOLleu_25717 [Holothuria leucospilota]
MSHISPTENPDLGTGKTLSEGTRHKRRWHGWKGKHRLDKRLTVGAEKGIVRYVQRRCYSIEFSDLKSGKAISRRSSIFKFESFKDDDEIFRVQGPLQEAPFNTSAMHALILPKDHHVTKLIVRHVHERVAKHSGRECVLSRLWEKNGYHKVAHKINRVLSNCVVCKKLRGKAGVQKWQFYLQTGLHLTSYHSPTREWTVLDRFM